MAAAVCAELGLPARRRAQGPLPGRQLDSLQGKEAEQPEWQELAWADSLGKSRAKGFDKGGGGKWGGGKAG